MSRMTADLGSVPDWIGGLGTTAATILLAAGWWRESKLRREDRQRQAAITIRQLLLDIDSLYDDHDGKPLTAAGRRAKTRNLREIETQSVALPRPFGERIEQTCQLYADSTADDEATVAHNCGSYARSVASAFLRGNPPPPPPPILATYEKALDQAPQP
jgi:hypothetical protein